MRLALGFVVALGGCHALLGLDEVGYREPIAAGGGGAGGSEGGGGGDVAPLEGAPRWLFVVDDEDAATAGLLQRGLDGAFDDAGRAALAFHFVGKVDLSPSPGNSGAADVLLVTLDEDGAHLRHRDHGDADDVDAKLATLGEDIFVTGTYTGQNLDVGNLLSPACTLDVGQTTCPPDLYTVKYDGDLDHRWSRSDGGNTSSEGPTAIDTALPDGVIVGGVFDAAVSVYGQSLSYAAGIDPFVARIRDRDVSGITTEWAVSFGGPDDDWLVALDARDASVAIVIRVVVAEGNNLVLRNLDAASGGEQWDAPPTFIGDLLALDVALAPDGSVVVAARLDGPTTTPEGDMISPGGATDLLLVWFEPDGSIRWSKQYPASGAISSARLAIDDQSHIALGGTVSEILELGPDHQLDASGSRLGFVAKLDGEGAPLWSRLYAPPGTSSGESEIAAVDVTPEGEILTVGSFTGTIDFELVAVTSTPMAMDGAAEDALAAFAMRHGP